MFIGVLKKKKKKDGGKESVQRYITLLVITWKNRSVCVPINERMGTKVPDSLGSESLRLHLTGSKLQGTTPSRLSRF